MLENRKLYDSYFSSENEKSWVVKMIDVYGANRGCKGFKFKKDAIIWLNENIERINKHFQIIDVSIMVE